MLVISYYTPDGNYRAYADKLRASCDRFGIRHMIEELPSRGEWVRNIGLKPRFTLEKLQQTSGPVVWMDADCEIMQKPTLLEDDRYDLMIYNWYAEPNPGVRFLDPTRLGAASGVFKIGHSRAAVEFMRRWVGLCDLNPGARDDVIMSYVFETSRGLRLRTRWLPKAYNRMDSHWPGVTPVINHVYTDGTIFTDGAEVLRTTGIPVRETDIFGRGAAIKQ
ncbi:MAG TPA: hypothetical protein VD997_14485 [Phycisphaerales bacterium]|nr:hypothetical protein [Phycisphaerales bacterium]